MSVETNEPIGFRIKLKPNDDTIKVFREYFSASRFIYNTFLYSFYRYKDEYGRFPTDSQYALQQELTEMKTKPEYEWLNSINIETLRIAIKDVRNAVSMYIKQTTENEKPVYKKKKKYYGRESFGVRADRVKVCKNHVYLPSIGFVQVGQEIDENLIGYGNKNSKPFNEEGRYIRFLNTRVAFNGLNYYLTFTLDTDLDNHISAKSVEKFMNDEGWKSKPYENVIGIDMGCKLDNWLVTSDGSVLSRPDNSKFQERKKGFQRQLARQYKVNDKRWEESDPSNIDKMRPLTNRERKTLLKWNKLEKHMTNRKLNAIHEFISHEIIDKKPEAVVIEDIRAKELFESAKNSPPEFRKKYCSMVNESMINTIRVIFEQKMKCNGIKLIIADKEFPSSQLCSSCGYRMDIKSKRVFKCPECGMVMDRDKNAAINLKLYGEKILSELETE